MIAFVSGQQARAVVRDGEIVNTGARGNAPHQPPGVRIDFDDLARLVTRDVD